MKKQAPAAASGPDNRWTLAFAIIMLLLFALFLVLYSVSKKETVKLREEIETIRTEKQKPSAPKEQALPVADHSSAREAGILNADLQTDILNEAKSFLSPDAQNPNAKSDVEVMDLANGDFLVRIATPDLFKAGSSKVSLAARPFVDRLGELILKSGRRLRIEGHADFEDSETIQRKASGYANTWELSAARSSALAQYWMRKFNLDPAKVEAAGFGKYRPLEKKVGRSAQANRRIEIIILRTES